MCCSREVVKILDVPVITSKSIMEALYPHSGTHQQAVVHTLIPRYMKIAQFVRVEKIKEFKCLIPTGFDP